MLEKFEINNTCTSCDACRVICPEGSIITDGKEYTIDPWSCTKCSLCVEICSANSIKVLTK